VEAKAAFRQLAKIAQVLDDRNSSAEQHGVNRPVLIGRVVDVE
jgi:hypothetical protein